MKSYIISLLFFTLLINVKLSKAQDSRPQVRFRAGQSTPTDDFESINPNKRKSGYAENGFVVGLGIQQPLVELVDATAEISLSNYDLNGNPLLRQIELEAPSYNWTLSDGTYQVKNVTVGVRFYGGHKFKFYVNPVIGFSWISFPSIALNGSKIVDRETVTAFSRKNIETSRSFMFGINAGLEYLISDNFGFNVQFEQIKYDFETDSRVDFKDVNQNEGSFTTDDKGEYAVINLTVGLIFKFDWKEEE